VSNDAYSRAGRQTSGWAVGFILFAAIMMIMAGVFQALQGLVAIFENEFYVATRNYLFQFDAPSPTSCSSPTTRSGRCSSSPWTSS
jgi:hypothetical protein